MNLRNVLRTYALLRSLTDDESALLETLRKLNDTERELLVGSLSPGRVVGKKAAKKSSAKSPRASGMAKTIGDNLRQKRGAPPPLDLDHDPNDHCQKQFDGGFVCDEPADANVHHLRGATGYHEFDAGKLSAQGAGGRSSTNGAAQSSIPSTGEVTESAQSAAGGSSD